MDYLNPKGKKCCICGISATNKHMTIIGQIPFFVCDEHYESTTPYYGFEGQMFRNSSMGLEDKITGEPLPMFTK